MLTEAWRVARAAVAVAVAWGLLEASWRFLTVYHQHAAHQPFSGVSLYLAALFNYGLLGLAGGVVAFLARCLLALLPAGRMLARWPFLLAVLAAALLGGLACLEARRGPLQGLDRGDPRLALAFSGIAAVAAVLAAPVYLALRRAGARARRSLAARPRLAHALRAAPWALPAALTVAGIVLAVGRGAGLLPLRRAEGIAFPPPAAAAAATLARPNLILLSLETTRADHINALGYGARVTSPTLDGLGHEGVLFRRAYAQAPWTAPSMASLFSSLYPSQHGIVASGRSLAPAAVTLPEALAAAGYTTASFYSNHFANQEGFGFAEAYGRFPRADPYRVSPVYGGPFLIRGLQRDLLTLSLRITFPRDERWYNGGDRLNAAALAWLARRPPAPFLLHIHYLDPHDPYFEHPPLAVQVDPRSAAHRDELVRRYDGEIRYADERIGELLAALRGAGYLEDAVVAVTADHGEEFLDHGGWGHRHHLYGELLRVPLILAAPGRLPAGVVVDAPVSTVDIAPTLLDLAGLPAPPSFEGASLLPVVRGEDGGREILSQLTSNAGEGQALIAGEWKLLRPAGGEPAKLFHALDDPLDRRDLAAERPEVVARLASRLDAWLADLAGRALAAATEELTGEELDQLRALGYVD